MERRYRLRDPKRFQQVRRQGRCWSHPLCVLCVLPNGLPYSRFGFSVSRRVGKAAKRNRAKRRLREIVRQRQNSIRPGYDLVFIARPPIVDAPHEALVAAVESLLREARLWDARPAPESAASRGPREDGGDEQPA